MSYSVVQDACDISRSTLFNWFKRENPPPGLRHHEALAKLFPDESLDYILYGKLDKVQNSDTQELNARQGELNNAHKFLSMLLHDRDSQVEVSILRDQISQLQHEVKELKSLIVHKNAQDEAAEISHASSLVRENSIEAKKERRKRQVSKQKSTG